VEVHSGAKICITQ